LDGRDEPGTVLAGEVTVAARRAALVNLPWTWLRQVHGIRVVTVDRPGQWSGSVGDALVTRCSDAALAVFTADCAPVALSSPEGVVGVAHAGWRGLMAGVVEATIEAMRSLGATTVEAWLGPCIGSECYEFGAADLDLVADALGDSVRAITSEGTPALDLAAGVAAALGRIDVRLVGSAGGCTACSGRWYSHRARADPERQATVVWLPSPAEPTAVDPSTAEPAAAGLSPAEPTAAEPAAAGPAAVEPVAVEP
jgi:YfiH family protein